jgi:hypothetical protein
MRTQKILHQWLSNVLIKMHKKRHEALGSLVSAAIEGGKLTVTSLGRSIVSDAREKHNIKRADRLLSNKHLQGEVFGIYKRLARKILGQVNIPIILIDWSDIEQSQSFFLLRA